MRKRVVLKKYRYFVNILIKISNIIPNLFLKKILKITRNWDSLLAIFVRYICLKNICAECGDNVAIFSEVYLLNIDNLKIGDNVSIHPMCYIDATGGITIGNDVSIAHSTTIMSTEHEYSDINVNIKDQGCKNIPVYISNNVWIGAGTRILAGSYINQGSIVGAGAVVKNEIEKNTIVAGVPAKKIKKRI